MDEIFDLIYRLEAESNYEEALNHLDIAFEEKLGSFNIRNDMGRIHNKMRRFDDALSNFDIVLASDDSNPEYLFGKGISLIGLNRFEESYDVFDSLTGIDEDNANGWYYKALLSKSLDYPHAQKFFNRFLKLDNDDFRQIRSYYKFGIHLNECEQDLRGYYKLEILSEIKEEIHSLNIDEDKYEEILRVVPLEDLFGEILELKGDKMDVDVDDIIRREFKKQGLTDKDVDDLFVIETTENLKKEVLELCDENPFPESGGYSQFTPFKLASRYNIRRAKLLVKNKDLLLFNRGNVYFDEGKLDEAIECYDEALEYAPENFLLKFVKYCTDYKLQGDSNA